MAASRMGLVLLAMVAFLLSFRSRKLALLAIAAVILVATLLPEQYWTRFAALGQFGGIVVDRSLQLRQHALEVAWTMFKSHPFTGVGLGNVVAEGGRYMSEPKIAHNTYVAILASIGIFGFLAFATWIASGIGMALRSLRLARIENRATAKSLSSMILISFVALLGAFVTLDLAFHPIVWWLLALANVMRQDAERGLSWEVARSSYDEPVPKVAD
jgi:O-antigen ligase